jgi:alpha-L-fucosidase 2
MRANKEIIMRRFALLCVFTLFFITPGLGQAASPGNLVLWQDWPAGDWQRYAYPLGNGNLGCMVFGHPENERIQFNQDTLWVGSE